MEVAMRLGEVGLLSNDVLRLANFYKAFLGIENGSDDRIHQTIIEKPTMRPWGARNMSFYDPDKNIIYLRTFIK